MMRALEIVSASWPIAFMFFGLILCIVALRVIGAIRQSAREDKFLKSETARNVSQYPAVRNNSNDDY